MICDACAETPPPELLKGIEEFNRGEYFEQHETLELLWRAETREVRRLYQGILQIGVGFHHWRNGNFRGASLLLRDGIDKTSRFLPSCLGVDTARLCAEAQDCLDVLHELGRERLREFDWARVPRVHLLQ